MQLQRSFKTKLLQRIFKPRMSLGNKMFPSLTVFPGAKCTNFKDWERVDLDILKHRNGKNAFFWMSSHSEIMGKNFAIFLRGKWKDFVHWLSWAYSGTSLHTWQFNVVCPKWIRFKFCLHCFIGIWPWTQCLNPQGSDSASVKWRSWQSQSPTIAVSNKCLTYKELKPMSWYRKCSIHVSYYFAIILKWIC